MKSIDMSEWNTYKLIEAAFFQRGHDLTREKMKSGSYPVGGSNGVIGYHNDYTCNGPGITIGRSGNIGTPHFYKSQFWAHNTVLYTKEFRLAEPLYLYYNLKTIDFSQFNAGSSVPTLNRNHIHELDITLPPLPEQKAIASVLSSLDDKIDLLQRQNQTLEAMAEALFKEWFVLNAKEEWEEKTFG
jgi:type I restriction enzyme S subunit